MKLILVDDHSLFREGLRVVLGTQPDLEVVGEAASATDAYPLIEQHQPDVVVLDVSLPGCDGFAATREILRRVPSCAVLVLTMHVREEYAARALSAGATGYALKDQATDEVVHAIRTVAKKELYLAPRFNGDSLMEYMQQRAQRGEGTSPFDQLTPREQEVFDLAVRGFSNEGIGGELGISVKTVETHRARINRKLNAHCTGDLVRLAARHGRIPELLPDAPPKPLRAPLSVDDSSRPVA